MPIHALTRSAKQGPTRSHAAEAALNAHLLTHKEYETGSLVELHGVGLAQFQDGPGVPGEEPALEVVEHLHAALSRDHVSFCVQQNQGGNT